MSPPVHLLGWFNFKHKDKNPRGKGMRLITQKEKKMKMKHIKIKRAKFMITSTRDPIICNGSVAHRI